MAMSQEKPLVRKVELDFNEPVVRDGTPVVEIFKRHAVRAGCQIDIKKALGRP
jgi:hypothetical protein